MAWNEPGGEKRNPWNRPQQSQNDLDDVLRNFQRRLSALFGRGGGATGGGGGQSSTNFGKSLGSILILIGAVWIGSGLYRVDDDASMLTADTNLVEVKSAVQYIQPDAIKLLFKVRDVEDTLTQVSESAMREAVGQASLDKALAYDVSITNRAKFLLQRTLDSYDMGIQILGVKLTGVNVPEAVQDAQRDAIKADKDRQRYQQDAETYRNDVLPRARGAAAKEVLDAEAYRLQVLALAQGQTARFDQVLAQYEHAPAVTRERMYLESMENVYKNSRKVIVDTKTGNSMMYLTLDKLNAPGPQSISMPNDTMTVPPARVPDIQVSPPEDPARARGVR